MYNEECEWEAISDIFSKAVHRQNISKSDVEKMIEETKNEIILATENISVTNFKQIKKEQLNNYSLKS